MKIIPRFLGPPMEGLLAVHLVWKTLPVVVVVLGVGWWAVVRFQLPFVRNLYWKCLAGVAVLATSAWALVLSLTDYKPMEADCGGTIITSAIFAYLVHLWVMPYDEMVGDEQPEPYGAEDDDDPGHDDADNGT